MTRCMCGYCTNDKDQFIVHLVNGWNDLRKEHSLN
ncbi:hypothetical protein EMGBD3_09780 [Nitrosarchaeum sp.]|jgi:hypothetical protein|nr:hypothetical protein EMGBD3_09780 [Nitrosarchaeum sp.]